MTCLHPQSNECDAPAKRVRVPPIYYASSPAKPTISHREVESSERISLLVLFW